MNTSFKSLLPLFERHLDLQITKKKMNEYDTANRQHI